RLDLLDDRAVVVLREGAGDGVLEIETFTENQRRHSVSWRPSAAFAMAFGHSGRRACAGMTHPCMPLYRPGWMAIALDAGGAGRCLGRVGSYRPGRAGLGCGGRGRIRSRTGTSHPRATYRLR